MPKARLCSASSLPSSLKTHCLRGALMMMVAAAALVDAPAAAHAQTATPGGGAASTVATGFSFAYGVESDSKGDVFISDLNGGTITELVAVNGTLPATPAKIVVSSLSSPLDAIPDSAGNVYFASGTAIKEIVATGGVISASSAIVTIATRTYTPTALAFDASGNLFFVEYLNTSGTYANEVGKIAPTGGTISPGAAVSFTVSTGTGYNYGIALDANGDVFVADSQDSLIKEIVATGGAISASSTVNTVVSSGLNYPRGLKVDSSGNLYIANQVGGNIIEVLATGGVVNTSSTKVTLVSGLTSPSGLARYANGTLFYSSYTTVGTYLTTSTIPTTPVGTSSASSSITFTVGTAGTLPTLSNANVLTQGASGLDFTLGAGSTCTGAVTAGQVCTVNVVFTPKYPGQRLGAVNLYDSTGTNLIATALISGTGTGPLLTLSPGLISTVAGNGSSGYTASQDAGTTAATAASLNYPSGVATDGAGNLYIADYINNRVRKVTAATGFISTVAGNGTACAAPTASPACGDGAAATAASIQYPISVAVDGAGNLYISDAGNQRIRKVTASTGFISTVAGNGTATYVASQDMGTTAATATSINGPNGVVVDGAGNLYIADQNNNRIRKVTASTGFISTVAGNGVSGYTPSQDTGTTAATAASLSNPSSVVVDGAGNLYIADSNNQRIRRVTASTGFISTVAGNGSQGYTASQDTGTTAATATSLNDPNGIAVDAAGNLYIADQYNLRIRKVTAATGFISTVAGNGVSGYTASQNTGTTAATAASLQNPAGVAVDGAGNLYIGGYADQRVRKVTVTGSIVFPTATAAGSADTTDGTQTLIANNIGNATLTFVSQVETGSSFVLGNPMTGGCVPNGTIAAGGSCLIGATFAPVAGSLSVVNGNVLLTDNSLNVTGSTQNIPLSGVITAGSVTVDIGSNIVTSGTASVNLPVVIGFSGAVGDQGTITVLVNGSSAGVNAPASCVAKASHKNCAYTYTGTLLNTPGNYTTSVTVAADAADGYSAASTTGYLTVNGVAGHARPAPGGPGERGARWRCCSGGSCADAGSACRRAGNGGGAGCRVDRAGGTAG